MTEIIQKQNGEGTEGNGKGTFWLNVTPKIAPQYAGTTSQVSLDSSIDTLNEQALELARQQIIVSKSYFKRVVRIPVRQAVKDQLNEIFNLITDASDKQIDPAERSNYFDDWKSELRLLARKAEHFTKNHNVILGAVIVSTQKRDITDFSDDTVNIFLQVTNLLRQSNITKREKTRIIESLIDARAQASLPLGTEDLLEKNKRVDELEVMVAKIIEKSRTEL